MAINTQLSFDYEAGTNPLSNIKASLIAQSNAINNLAVSQSITGSVSITGSFQTNAISLPSISTALPTLTSGSLMVSGSGANIKLYFFNGVAWMTASMSTI